MKNLSLFMILSFLTLFLISQESQAQKTIAGLIDGMQISIAEPEGNNTSCLKLNTSKMLLCWGGQNSICPDQADMMDAHIQLLTDAYLQDRRVGITYGRTHGGTLTQMCILKFGIMPASSITPSFP